MKISVTKYITLSLVLVIGAFALWYFVGAEAGVKYLYNLRGTGNDGLVGYWPLDGNANDESGRDNNGTLTGTTVTTGKVNTALYFNGVADEIRATNVITGFPFTLSAWVKSDASASGVFVALNKASDGAAYLTIGDVTTGYWLGCRNLTDGAKDLLPSTPVPNTSWHLLTGVFNSATSRELFFDGASIGTQTTSCSFQSGIDTVIIGQNRVASPLNYYEGIIDDVRVYNRALSAGEIKTYYDTTLSGRGFLPADTAAGGGGVNSGSVSNNVLTGGLVGHWTFDGQDVNWATGNVSDLSGQGNTSKQISMATSSAPTEGVLGQGFLFDGVNDLVDFPAAVGDELSPTATISVGAWIKTDDAVSANQVVVDRLGSDTGYALFVNNTGKASWGIDGGFGLAESSVNVDDRQWHYIMGTYNKDESGSAQMKIYVDGVLRGTANRTAVINYGGATRSAIGAFGPAANSNYFKGVIDDVRIYNRALTPSEVEGLYNLGAAGKRNLVNSGSATNNVLTGGLVGHWTFDGQDVNWATGKVNDLSGNGNTGKQKGMATSTAPTEGVLGQGFLFDGVDDYVRTQSIFNVYDLFSTGNTFTFWFKTTNAATVSDPLNGIRNPVMGGSLNGSTWLGSFGLDGGKMVLQTYPNVETWTKSTNSYADGQWHFGALTRVTNSIDASFNNGTCVLYVDMVSVINTSSCTFRAADTFWRINGIGAFYKPSPGGVNYFDGSLDDVRVYNRALLVGEIKQLYDLGR